MNDKQAFGNLSTCPFRLPSHALDDALLAALHFLIRSRLILLARWLCGTRPGRESAAIHPSARQLRGGGRFEYFLTARSAFLIAY